MRRTYEQCRECGRTYYRDYVPYGLGNPILTLPCGHGVTLRWHQAVKTVSEAEALPAMLAAEVERRAAVRPGASS
jgi:hypothetical protein